MCHIDSSPNDDIFNELIHKIPLNDSKFASKVVNDCNGRFKIDIRCIQAVLPLEYYIANGWENNISSKSQFSI